jgi:hypothetical protein
MIKKYSMFILGKERPIYDAADIDPLLRDAREIAVFCHDKLFAEGSEMHKKARRIIDATEGVDHD